MDQFFTQRERNINLPDTIIINKVDYSFIELENK